jgi:hypothetical protein
MSTCLGLLSDLNEAEELLDDIGDAAMIPDGACPVCFVEWMNNSLFEAVEEGFVPLDGFHAQGGDGDACTES